MKLNQSERISVIVILFLSGILLYSGWRLFWFLTDDAYISFRYVSNSVLGYGYVWNPPPFRPVEGYTSFLWVALLDVVWRTLALPPPNSANYLSLLFSFLTLITASFAVLRLEWSSRLVRYRLLFLGLFLLGVTTNRTFLTWSSSGLETAMFNYFLIAWVCSAIFIPNRGLLWIFTVTASAVGVYLSRPDGILTVVATVVMLLWNGRKGKPAFGLKQVAATLPLLLVPVHLFWRRSLYGAWLPNTYFAKYSGMWPESGVRYLLSFILEYALWLWLGLLIVVWLKRTLEYYRARRELSEKVGEADSGFDSRSRSRKKRMVLIVSLTIIIQVLYYTFVIGGDHFEYRVYSPLILFIFISFIWLLNVAKMKVTSATALLGAFILLSYPVPWTHWWLTHRLENPIETQSMQVSVAEHWPAPISWYAGCFDRLQSWLIEHMVGMRHQEHKMFLRNQVDFFPSRSEGILLAGSDYPVIADFCVGYLAWVLPRTNIIDLFGLNDYVIARNRSGNDRTGQMAHERIAPEGYVECFSPNVVLTEGNKFIIVERERKLTSEDIIRCEREWEKRVNGK